MTLIKKIPVTKHFEFLLIDKITFEQRTERQRLQMCVVTFSDDVLAVAIFVVVKIPPMFRSCVRIPPSFPFILQFASCLAECLFHAVGRRRTVAEVRKYNFKSTAFIL